MISIIAPVYNVEKYLNQFIQSIIDQTFKDYELILVTDCPTDNSVEICEKFARQDNRIKVIKKEKNDGLTKTRNVGLLQAKGDYVIFADSDDYFPKDAVETLFDLIKKDNSDIAIGGFYCDTDGNIKKKKFRRFKRQYKTEEAIKYHLNFHTLYGYLWGKIFKREVLKGLNHPEDITIGEDGVFSFMALTNAHTISFTDKPVYYYRKRGDSLSNHGNNLREVEILDAFKQIDYIEKNLRNIYIYIYYVDLKIFTFGLLNGVIQKYKNSDKDTQKNFYKEYQTMKKYCDEYCNTVIFKSINPRMRWEAIKYKLQNN